MEPAWNDQESTKVAQKYISQPDKPKSEQQTLYDEMIDKRRLFCLNECQNNKVINMLRPKCKDRRYLDVLLLKKIPKKQMPTFCYEQRLNGLTRSFRDDQPLLTDCYIYIDDFWRIVRDEKAKTKISPSDLLRRTISRGKEALITSNPEKVEAHYIKNQLYILWPKLGLCLVGAEETDIHNLDMLKIIIQTLVDEFKLEINVQIDETLVELEFTNLDLKDDATVEKILYEVPYFSGYSVDTIWAEIQLPSPFAEEIRELKVKHVRDIFLTVIKCLNQEK